MDTEEFNSLQARILRNRFIPLPPQSRNQSCSRDTPFLNSGIDLMRVVLAQGLAENESLLDLGCGYGRLALPLTQYLSDNGRYFGVDINLGAVAWCHENISQCYTNFEFAVLNARNDHYKNKFEYGTASLRDCELPIPDGRKFEAITAFSLFTHLLWPEVEWYFKRIKERLAPNGRATTSWFLINAEREKSIQDGQATFAFDLSSQGPAFLLKDTTYSQAIAHSESALFELAETVGLRIAKPPTYGAWHAGKPGQDVLTLSLA